MLGLSCEIFAHYVHSVQGLHGLSDNLSITISIEIYLNYHYDIISVVNTIIKSR